MLPLKARTPVKRVATLFRAALEKLPWRPSLLALTAAAAGVSALAHAVTAAAPAADPVPQTRLGASIQQSVRERDQALAREKRALDLREQAARASEARLKADLQAHQATAARPGAGGPSGDAADPAQPYDDLARIYQSMKPARAAPIFERLDLEVQVQVARHMRERSIALILAGMSPNAAVELSMALAGRRVVRAQPAGRTDTPMRSRGPGPRGKAPAPALAAAEMPNR